LTILQTNTQINLDFSVALPAAKYTKLCMAWQTNIRQNAVPPPNPTPLEFSSEQDDISVEIWLRLQNYFGIIPKNNFLQNCDSHKMVIDTKNILLPLHNFLRITKALRKFIL